MPRFQLQRAAYFAGVFIVATAVIVAAGCGGRRSDQAREQGDIHLRLGQYDQAQAAYERALAADEGNARAHAGLGRLQRTRGEIEAALSHFNAALAADPALVLAHVEKAYALDALGRHAESIEAARTLSATNAEQAIVLEANLLNRQNRPADARSLLLAAEQDLPPSETLRMALAFANIRLRDFDAAESTLRSILDEIDTGSTAARMGLVEVYRQQGRLPAVVAEMEDFVANRKAAFEAQPSDRRLEMQYIGAQLQLALSLLELDRVDDAVAIVEPIVSDHPEMPWANFVMGACHLARGEISNAIVALQAAATAMPDEPMVQEKLALAQAGGSRRAGTPTSSTPTPGTPATSTPATPATRGERPAGSDIVGAQASLPEPAALDARPSTPVPMSAQSDWRTLWNTANLGRLLAGREAFLQESDAAREAIALAAIFTFNDALATEIADALPAGNPVRAFADAVASRDADTMRSVIESWEETTPERRVLRENAHGVMLSRFGMRGSALEVLSMIGQEVPDNVVAFFNLSTMYTSLGMHRLSALTLQRLLTRYPQALEARLLLYDTLERDGRGEDARLLAETTHALYPEEPQVLLQLAEAYATLGNLSMADTVLSSGVSARPDDAGLRVGLALVRLRNGQQDEASALLDDVEAEGRGLGAVAETRATIAALRGDWDAVRVHSDSAPLAQQSAVGWSLAISLAARAGSEPPALPALDPRDTSRMAAMLTAIGQAPADVSSDARALGERLAGDNDALADYALGLAYLFQRLHEPAYDALSSVRTRVTGSPMLVRQILASIESGVEVPERVAKAQRIVDAEVALPAAWLGMAQIHAALDDTDAQATAIERAFSIAAEDDSVLFARATQAEARGDFAKALDSYERLVALGSENPAVFNNYAYYLIKSGGDLDRAIAFAEQARELLPGNPQVRHTLGLAQLRKGMLEEARTNLGTALEMMPSDPTLLLDYGHLLIEEGDQEQGRQSIALGLRYAEQLGIPFDRREEAEALLAGT